MSTENVKKRQRRVYTGVVVSNKMDKTIVVKVSGRVLHRLYKKYVVKSKKMKAHDEKNTANIGDIVQIVECRPISKEKFCTLQNIIKQASV